MSKSMNSPNFLWKIEKFKSFDKKICPAIFIRGLKWQLTFSHYMEAGAEKIHLFLECLSASEELSKWRFRVESCIVYSDGTHASMKSAHYILKHEEWCIWSDSVTNLCKIYGPMNDITFLVIVIPIGNIERLFMRQRSVEGNNDLSLCVNSLMEDFGQLFNNDEHSDFLLKCGGRNFYVHKSVLSARSDFFRAMFRSGMKETKEGVGNIQQLEPDTLEHVLYYLYTGKILEISADSLREIYAAAERFSVEPLKVRCYSLFVDTIITNTEEGAENMEDSESDEENSDAESEEEFVPAAEGDIQSEGARVWQEPKERKLLRALFMTREWRLFSQEFPRKAQEMCKPYLLQRF